MSVAYRFGGVEVRPVERRLLIDGKPAALGARAFEVLLALIDSRDRLVPKSELLDRVWPGLFVEENNLQVHISVLRKLLGPQAITTIPGRGYRFSSAIDAEPGGDPIATVPKPPAAAPTVPAPRLRPTSQESCRCCMAARKTFRPCAP